MHDQPYNFVKRCVAAVGIPAKARVVEFGSFDMNGSVRDLFPESVYTGVDWRPGKGVDVVCLAHDYAPQHVVDVVVSTQMLEHDPHAELTVKHGVRLLAANHAGGTLILTWAGPGYVEHELDTAPPVEGAPEGHQHYRNLSQDEVEAWILEATAATKMSAEVHRESDRDGLDAYIWAALRHV